MESGTSDRLLMEDSKAPSSPAAAAARDERDAFDDLLEAANSHGKFQIRFNIIFNLTLCAIVSMSFLNYVMAMTVPDHWCHVPGALDANISAERWKELTLPREGETTYSKCKMFNVTAEDIIMEQFFNQSVIHKEIIGCQYGWEYDKTWYKSTVPSDNDWVCENELRVTNIFMFARIGDVVGAFVFGQLGDVIGRKKVYILSITILLVGRTAAVFCSGIYPLFAICMFIANSCLLTVFHSPLAIGTEFSSCERRSSINMLQCVGWTIGLGAMPLLAWVMSDWVTFYMATTVPSIIFLLIVKLMPESPRWLMAKGRPEEAHKILLHIAAVNGRKLPTNSLAMLKEASARDGIEKVYGIPSLFSSKRLAGYSLLIIICWGINSLSYYLLVLNVSNMSGNPFLNHFYQSIVELPANGLAMWSTDTIGRRWTQTVFFILLAISYAVLVAIVLNPALSLITAIFAVIAKFCVCISFYTVYLQAIETYPTCLRQTGCSTNIITANLLNIIGPYIVYLGTSVDARYPFIVLGSCAVVGVFASSFLPETLNMKLPQTLADAQNFGKGQRYWSFPKNLCSKNKSTSTKKNANNVI